MTSEPHLPSIGELVDGKYRIEAQLGEGGMGVVFAATHVQMDKRRALKWLLPQLARDSNAVRRFLAEAKIASKIDHPNVVSPIDVSVDTGAPYIVMELLEGQTLSDYLGDRPLPLADIAPIFMPILEAVAAAHDRRVVHRDLKPGNIFLARTSSGGGGAVPKVLDFGIAKVVDTLSGSPGTLTDQGAVLGTLHYMSPEQLQDSSTVGPPADIYALGVILYRMLSGRLPYEGNFLDLALRIREGRPAALSTHVAGLPEGLNAVVMRALAAAVDKRYADVRSFAAALAPHFPRTSLPSGAPLQYSPLPPRAADAPRKEISTLKPVAATRLPPSRSYRAWTLVFAIGLVAVGIGIALTQRLRSGGEAAAPTNADPAHTTAPVVAEAAAVEPQAPVGLVPSTTDAGLAQPTTSGWQTVPDGERPPPATPGAEPARAHRPKQSRGKPAPAAPPAAPPVQSRDAARAPAAPEPARPQPTDLGF